MELTLQKPGDHLFIRSVDERGIRIVDDYYSRPIIVSATHLIPDWGVESIGRLTEEQLEPIFRLEPEIALIGTGPKQQYLSPQLLMCFYGRQIGVEVMTTGAACRTFNVLLSESRDAVAALMPPD